MSIMSDLQSVADAIRSKTGKTSKMTLSDMPKEIKSISVGDEINFYDVQQDVLKFETVQNDLSVNISEIYTGTILTEV